jgi:1-acyl-sn-glycerol-3-phosphate acyltransferase
MRHAVLSPRARGILVALYAAISIVFYVLLQLPVMLVTLSGDFSLWLARKMWAPAGLWLCGMRLEVLQDRPLPAGPAIYASNHESALDIWILLRAIPRNLRFIAKQELFRIPLFGWYLSLARFIAVDRRNHERAVASLRRAGEVIRSGVSIIVFPEGTRSADATVQPFKKGPFVVAMEAAVPVVPIAIVGAARLSPKRRLQVSPGTVHVAFGEPVDPRAFRDRTELLVEVRRRIIALHVAHGGRGGDLGDAVAPPGREGSARA